MEKEIDDMYDCMNQVFDEAILKAVERSDKPGNTATPWDDFPTEWLAKRLDDEYKEWKKTGDWRELIDIINLACFLRLRMLYDKAEKINIVL